MPWLNGRENVLMFLTVESENLLAPKYNLFSRGGRAGIYEQLREMKTELLRSIRDEMGEN